jgi:amino acid transporter
MTKPAEVPALKRDIGFADLLLFYIVSGLSVRWIATAAAAGPSTILIWLLACCCFFLPLAASVLELSARYPQEGGLYVWTQKAFGDFSGFLAAWTYWMSNLPYFPAILYFGARSALFAFGVRGEHLAEDRRYFVLFALFWLVIITALNIRGLSLGKWLNNLGALGISVPISLLVGMAAFSALRFGSATRFTWAGLLPHADLKNAVFWSTIFFAFGGCEAGSFMGGEIKDARRTIPRALLASGVLLTLGYIVGTIAMLIALPSSQISGVGGFVNAIQEMCLRLHVGWLAKCIALLVAVSSVGGAAAYLSSTSRLPFVAGIDRYLPAVFAWVHPRWRTPWVAIGAYGLAGIVFALLSLAGTSVRGAYDVLVSMSIITYFIPYAFLFASMIRLQREPLPAGAMHVPGGRPVATLLASVGLASTLLTIVLSLFPAAEETHPALAVFKVLVSTLVLVGAGIAVFRLGQKRVAAEERLPTSHLSQ